VFHVFYSYFFASAKIAFTLFLEKPDFYIFFFPCFLKSLFVFAFSSYSVFNELPLSSRSAVVTRLQKHLNPFKRF